MLSKYCKVFMPFVEGICSVFEKVAQWSRQSPARLATHDSGHLPMPQDREELDLVEVNTTNSPFRQYKLQTMDQNERSLNGQ